MLEIDEIQQSQEVRDLLKEYLKIPKGFILFAGENGRGKTFACQAFLNDFNRIYRGGRKDNSFSRLINQHDLNNLFAKSIADYSNSCYLEEFINEPVLLILDDIGTRIPTAAFMDFLYGIADKRYNDKNKATMITTNLNAVSMRERFGDAFISRVASGKCVRCDGPDRRFNGF